jgi:DNA-directed RNA polymerase subunit M/transcription elongation factor TFIIS
MATNVNFSLSPGMATTNVIDYTTTAGQKLWNNATDKLSVELFDCESEGLRDFLELIRARSEVMGWSLSVLSIPVDVNDNLGDTQDFLSHYGEINLGHCREHALTYYNQQTRAAQDSMKSIFCLSTISASMAVLISSTADSTSRPAYRSLIQRSFADSTTFWRESRRMWENSLLR